MGCDIHCYLEYKPKDSDHWRSHGGRINPGRNYEMFAVMADVRNYGTAIQPFAPPRGLPPGLGYQANGDNTLFVTDDENDKEEGTAQRKHAESWVASGSSDWVDENKTRVTHPDWHSHSWLTAMEFDAACGQRDDNGRPYADTSYRAVLASLLTFEAEGYDARIVFWFDN